VLVPSLILNPAFSLGSSVKKKMRKAAVIYVQESGTIETSTCRARACAKFAKEK